MAECHPDSGLTKQDYYRMARNDVDREFDKRIAKKGFFESTKSIEAEREKALKKVHDEHWGGGRGYGGFTE